MKRLLIIIAITIMHLWTLAQDAASFDRLSFIKPASWTLMDNGLHNTYATINLQDSTFCIISFYNSESSLGNLQQDFNRSWKGIVLSIFSTTKIVEPQVFTSSKGLKYLQDEATVSGSQGTFFARLLVFEFAGKTQSVLFLSQTRNMISRYQPELESFLASLEQGNAANAANTNIISNTTTNFDDGWVTTIRNDYVLVSRNSCKFYLYYDVPLTNESRAGITDYFYIHQLAQQYTITNVRARSDQLRYMIEGDAKENSTGKPCYVLMEVVSYNGVAKTIIEVAPTVDELIKQIGTDYPRLRTYNRFGISLKDIAGTWQGNSGSTMQYYDYYSGAAAGASAVSTSKKFIFRNDGSYAAEFKGVSGMIGNMSYYQQEEKGKITVVSPWQISTTDEKKNTTLYDCWQEAVSGGMILHLTNHAYKALTYDLVREK